MRYFSICLIMFVTAMCPAKTIIVAQDGSGNYTTIQAGINASQNGDTIIVQPGTYAENVSFNGKAVTLTSTDPNNFGIVVSTIINANSGYGVIFDFAETNRSVLTGFEILGGGIYCSASSPTITYNVIEECRTAGILGDVDVSASPIISYNTISGNSGGGIRNCNGLISGNSITGNTANYDYTTYQACGGGLYNCNGTITNNEISNNTALGIGDGYSDIASGGGLSYCGGIITGNMIIGNTANASVNYFQHTYVYGGGLADCNIVSNNLIAGNVIKGADSTENQNGGGGVSQCNKIINNTIIGNLATGCYGGGIKTCSLIKNNIIAFNSALEGGGVYGNCTNSYNDYWSNSTNFGGGAKVGIGETCVDPLFVNLNNANYANSDYHLQSNAGHWNSNTQSWVIDDMNSPCIDAGDPCDPILYEPMPNGGRINMGAYGGTVEASKSPNGAGTPPLPICTSPVVGDLNGDCKVDFKDFAIMAANWLACNLAPPSACWQ